VKRTTKTSTENWDQGGAGNCDQRWWE